MNDKVHLLLIDDEKNYLLVLETLLTEAGYAVTALNDPETALAFLEESEVDIVITDMKMPRISGREVLERVKKNWPHIPVLIMTAFGSIESAVEAMRYGAFNYITKPFSNDELLLSIQNAAELARAHRQFQLLRESLEERYGKLQIIGRSRAIRDMLALVDRAVEDAEIGDDAPEGVEHRVEDQCLQRSVRIALRLRNPLDDGFEHLFHAQSRFAGGAEDLVRVATQQIDYLILHFVDHRRVHVDLVQYGNDLQVVLDSQVKVRYGLRLDTLRGIDH